MTIFKTKFLRNAVLLGAVIGAAACAPKAEHKKPIVMETIVAEPALVLPATNPKRAAEIKQAAMDLFKYQEGVWTAKWDWYGPDGSVAGSTEGTEEFSQLVDEHSQMLVNKIPAQNQTSYAMLSYNETEQKIIFLNVGARGDYWIMRQDPETGTMISDPHLNPDGSEMIIRFTTLRQEADAMDVQMEMSSDGGETWRLAFKQYLTRQE